MAKGLNRPQVAGLIEALTNNLANAGASKAAYNTGKGSILGGQNGYTSIQNGSLFRSDASATCLIQTCVQPSFTGRGITLIYNGFGKVSGTAASGWNEANGFNTVTLTASVFNDDTSSWVNCTFNGASSITVPVDSYVETDEVNIRFTPGVAIRYQLRVQTATGEYFIPMENQFNSSATINGKAFTIYDNDTNPANVPAAGAGTLTSNSTGGVATATANLVRANAVRGRGKPNFLPCVVLSDSIAAGTGDVAQPFYPYAAAWTAWANRAFSGTLSAYSAGASNTYTERGAAVLNIGVGGDEARWNSDTDTPRRQRLIQNMMNGSPFVAIVAYGRNDLAQAQTAASTYSEILDICAWLRSLGAVKIVVATLIPESTSTTRWATVAGQTTVRASERLQLNQLIRGGNAAYDGVLDIEQYACDPSDVNKFYQPLESECVPFTAQGTVSTTRFNVSGTGVLNLSTSGRYVNWVVRFDTGPNAGEYRRVTASDESGGAHRIFTDAFGSAVVAGDTGVLIPVRTGIGTSTSDGVHLTLQGHDAIARGINNDGQINQILIPVP